MLSQFVDISGNMSYTESFGDPVDLNSNTQKDNPFHRLRAKLFLFKAINDKIDIDIELAFDDFALEHRWFWLHGASVSFNELFDNSLFSIKLGKIPMNIGQFVNRVNEKENAVIGVPLAYHYRTLMDWSRVWDGNSQVILKRKRTSEAFLSLDAFDSASPVAYEAIWDYGININGFNDYFEYSFMISNGSLSNPAKNYHIKNDKQYSARIGFFPTDWLSFGASAATNKYLSSSENIFGSDDIEDFKQKLYGFDLSLQFMGFKLFTEYYDNTWDNINIEKEYKVSTGFAEIHYALPFQNHIEIVGRYDFMNFNKIKVLTEDASYKKDWWDSDLTRIEAGLKYQINLNLIMKVVYQQWDFEHYSTVGTSAAQLLINF